MVEVVSPESEIRDRERKPQFCAGAGITHFWRVERGEGGLPVIYPFELDPGTGAHAPGAIIRDRVKVGVPHDIDIDLSEIEGL